jgi:hypothetical protein
MQILIHICKYIQTYMHAYLVQLRAAHGHVSQRDAVHNDVHLSGQPPCNRIADST